MPDESASPIGPKSHRASRAEPLLVDLALQGGGSHGAFTWGVLDRLLEEQGVTLEAISGTSAGAMNAAVLAHGLLVGGREGARNALHEFWHRVANAARFSPFQRSPLDRMMGRWSLDCSPMYIATDLMARLISPYSLGGGGTNPLREILTDIIDFERLAAGKFKLFITCTNVRTGRGRVFRNPDITPDVLLASACLPTMFQAVQIDGEPYWDGGYSGNPTIAPLVRECQSHDTFLVQINPILRN
jgi:NTE family protein